MRIIIAFLLGGLYCSLVNPASAGVPYTFGGDFNTYTYTSLIDTNQSQTFEPMSVLSLRDLPRYAGVTFITDGSRKNIEFGDPNSEACKNSGYTTPVSSCTAVGKIPGILCSFDGDFTDKCCDPAYKYKKTDCSYPQTVSGDSLSLIHI